MIRINQIKLPISHTDKELIKKAANLLDVEPDKILSCKIVKKSIDARKKPEIYFIYAIDIETENEDGILGRLSSGRSHRNRSVQITKAKEQGYSFPDSGEIKINKRPVIIGTGPAGLFCGYYLSLYGYRPILLERGKAVDERRKDVEKFWESGVLNTDSNVQFGEGGAGTFSDGKLNTLIKDKTGRNKEVLKVFVRSGAPEEILYEAKPHIGTDILMNVVKNMRNEITAHGGEVRFESKVTDIIIDKDRITGVIINDSEQLSTDIVVFAIGHSARDTFYMLNRHGVPMEAKAFAVGLRVEHPRKFINNTQYGMEENKHLPTANYKLTAKATNGRGVYSFCMCPGGYVVNASSEEGRLAINGMSYSKRNGDNSNSAIIITVTPEDFESTHPFSGVEFQRLLEKKAFEVGKGQVPVETYGDFRQAVTGAMPSISVIAGEYPDFKPQIKGAYSFAPVHKILPEVLNQSFVEGMEQFNRMMPGFADSGVYVSGVESRTSSPVRIHRDELGQSQIRGLYPCGEGAGYAGGITSAAMDGMAIAEKIASVYKGEK
ncbi:MAG: FAD-dependent oxidoreductase [Lachnospiraceae bacterium]|nr:FAD-dependent oxidoreductase [Lachnospiraceae bacterium]